MENQNKQILKHLQDGFSITSLEALKLFDCLRLSARIFNLRQLGHSIVNLPHKTNTGKTVAKYSLKV